MWLPRTLRTIFLLLNSCYSFSFAGASSSPCTFNMTCHQGSILRLSLHSLFHFSSSLQICPSIPFLSRLLAVHPSSSSDQKHRVVLDSSKPTFTSGKFCSLYCETTSRNTIPLNSYYLYPGLCCSHLSPGYYNKSNWSSCIYSYLTATQEPEQSL